MPAVELRHKIAFAAVRGMGYDLATKILDVLPSEADFFALPQKDLAHILQAKNKIIDEDYRRQLLVMADREIEFIEKNAVGVTYFSDSDFPVRLSNAPDSPIILYYKGDPGCLSSQKAVSVVGTRHATTYGQHFCDTLIADMADSLVDTVIISGLAYGIDVAAHRAALANNVPTIAVLAHGLNTIYPSQHRNIADEIVRRGGLLVTDYTSQSPLTKGNFLARNRIVAGLADCTVIVESAQKGGAMTTARIAASYNRDVFALPGKTSDPFSAGCNKLIRDNLASLITCLDDMAKAMRWNMFGTESTPRQMKIFPELTPEERTITDYLATHPDCHVNVIRAALGMPMPQLLNLLIELEFKGAILTAPGNKYTLA